MPKPSVLVSCIRLHASKTGAFGGNFYLVLQLIDKLVKHTDFDFTFHVDQATASPISKIVGEERCIHESKRIDSILQMELATKRAIRVVKPSIFHKPVGQLPIAALGTKTIWGLADLVHKHVSMNLAKKIYKELSFKFSILQANRILCISKATQNELLKYYPNAAAKAQTVYCGATYIDATPKPVEAVKQPYFLTFGHRVHKNVESVFAGARALKDKGHEFSVVVVGECPHQQALTKLCNDLNLQENVCFLGRVDGGQLRYLYQNANSLVFLSKHEGFGLPVLEAMKEDCPVIASNLFSLPEVTGDAGIVVDCENSNQVVSAMEQMLCDPGVRSRYIELGRQQIEKFTWENTALNTIAVYREALGNDL